MPQTQSTKHKTRFRALAAVLLASAIGVATGCGSSIDRPQDTERAARSTSEPTGAVVHNSSPRPLPAPDAIGAPESTVETYRDASEYAAPAETVTTDPHPSAARESFNKLLKPGISAEDWEDAQQQLLSLGESAILVLIDELEHGNALRRETAATALALMGTPSQEAASALLNALKDESLFVRANAATALVLSTEHAGPAVPVLVELLKSDDPQMRQLAATNLGVLGPEAAAHVEQLTRSLSDEISPDVLLPVVELLGRIGPAATPAVPNLQKMAFEQSGEISRAATNALDLIQSSRNK